MPKMHKQTIDLTGQTFGQLLVLAYAGRRKKNTCWRCKCLACGSVKNYYGSNLCKGLSTQCQRCPAKPPKRRSDQRCRQPGYLSWKKMTKRGEVCKRWLSFETFIADMGEPTKGKRFLTRIDPTKPYKPGNCTWAAGATVRLLKYKGRAMSVSDWSRELGLSRQTLYDRLRKMSVHKALAKSSQQ